MIMDKEPNVYSFADECYVYYGDYKKDLQEKDKEIERLKEIAHKMHLWIFLHSEDEQKVYDELGLTDEENDMLGYSGQFRIGEDYNKVERAYLDDEWIGEDKDVKDKR